MKDADTAAKTTQKQARVITIEEAPELTFDNYPNAERKAYLQKQIKWDVVGACLGFVGMFLVALAIFIPSLPVSNLGAWRWVIFVFMSSASFVCLRGYQRAIDELNALEEDEPPPSSSHQVSALWYSGKQRPEPMTADETGCTTGLVLIVRNPADGGPNVRQGLFDHCARHFIDSTTGQALEPDEWGFAPAEAFGALYRCLRRPNNSTSSQQPE